jgi:hypothetical protein
MEIQNPKRPRSLVYFQDPAGPESSSRLVETLVTDTIPHIGEDHFPIFEEIHSIFEFKEFPKDNEVLEVYQNILKSRLHQVASRPQLFPYNEAAQWCLKQFDSSTALIMRKQGE